MIVQIYGAKRVDDALALVEMGVDFLGLEMEAGLEEERRVAEIVWAVRGRVTVVLLPILEERAAIEAAVARLRPDVVHVASKVEAIGPEAIAGFRAAVHPAKVMKSIPVALPGRSHGVDSLGQALAFDALVDYLLLDTQIGSAEGDPVPGWIGITGKTHDWQVSRAIVERCRSPVILAGGLAPENVAEAIAAVRPWGVDANTGLNLAPGKKDLARCRAFVERARAAAGG